ncbi:hypothetical protein ACFL4S_00425 [bacterium]
MLLITDKTKFILKTFSILFLLAWYCFLVLGPINLTTADLGRHLKNGELIVEQAQDSQAVRKILNTGFYSYTHPDFPFINHHWGSGVVFYFLHKFIGFNGLSVFYILLLVTTFLCFLAVSYKHSGFLIACMLAFFVIPILAERREIRPEIFGYLFLAVFVVIIDLWERDKINTRWLYSLPVLGFLWINLHISFFFGLLYIFVVIFEKIILIYFSIKKDTALKIKSEIKILSKIGLAVLLASLINPFGIKSVLYPLKIFENYGYKLIENQSVRFLENYGIYNSNFLLFKMIFILLIVSFVLVFLVNKKKFSIRYFCMNVIFGILSCLAIRNFVLFGYFAFLALSYNIYILSLKKDNIFLSKGFAVFVVLILAGININQNFTFFMQRKDNLGSGLIRGINKSAEFIKQNNIKGAIFNNYDIGGYLIYHFYPEEKVFIDNRPEAYPAQFFQKIYIPMQEDPSTWDNFSEKYNFNVIFFQRNDLTGWAQNFLIQRVRDPLWSPVFVDNHVLIFLKRNEENKEVIKKYEIPKNWFTVRKS